jgi:hypothetical protein
MQAVTTIGLDIAKSVYFRSMGLMLKGHPFLRSTKSEHA